MLHRNKLAISFASIMRTAVVLAVTVLSTSAFARDSGLGEKALQLAASAGEGVKAVREAFTNSATPVQAQGQIEVAFSPNLGAEELVIRVTDSAKKDLRVMAYAFTSSKITSALIRAAKRGVNVYLLADEKQNLGAGAGPKGRAALSALSLAGVHVRVVDAYPIFHDKVQISDGRVLQTGSFNYSDAAAKRNSENVIVHWDNPELASAYAEHFARNWKLSKAFNPSF